MNSIALRCHSRPRPRPVIHTVSFSQNDWAAVLDRAHENNAYAPLAGPGHFNDPDAREPLLLLFLLHTRQRHAPASPTAVRV